MIWQHGTNRIYELPNMGALAEYEGMAFIQIHKNTCNSAIERNMPRIFILSKKIVQC